MARAGVNRERITQAALRVVDAEGWDHLSLAAVAKDVGVKLPSLYKHVASLAEVRGLVSAAATGQLADALVASVMGRSGDDAVISLARAYRAFAHASPGRYMAALVAPAPGDERHQVEATRAYEAVTAAISGYGLDDAHAVHAIRSLRALLHGFVSLEAAGGFGMPVDIDESFDKLTADVTRLLR